MHHLDDHYRLTGHIPSEELQDCINIIPALFWRIELTNNRIEYLNSHRLAGLEEDSNLLLQNMNFSRQVILEEDYHQFEEFMSAIRDRRKSLRIVRVKHRGSAVHWLKLVGATDPYHSHYYLGYILDITDAVDIIRRLDSGVTAIGDKIDIFENPVIICDFSHKRIRAANRSARSFFGYGEAEFMDVILDEIFSDDFERHKLPIFEDIIFHDRWNGEIGIRTREDRRHMSDVTIRPMIFGGENLLWISVYNISSPSGEKMVDSPPATDEVPSPLNSAGIINTLNETADSGDLGKIMEALLRHQPREGLAESVLYSDIHQAEKIVRVYGSGPFFRDLGYGETFSFEGTIAENIIRFNLQKIIVEDTMKSIKPIDWALFIPHGVRSYYAQPFFDNDKLHTVLIFCSGKPGAFTEENVTPYHELFPFFLRGLEACRSRKSYQKT